LHLSRARGLASPTPSRRGGLARLLCRGGKGITANAKERDPLLVRAVKVRHAALDTAFICSIFVPHENQSEIEPPGRDACEGYSREIGDTFRCSGVLKPGSRCGEPPQLHGVDQQPHVGWHADREAAMRAVEKELEMAEVQHDWMIYQALKALNEGEVPRLGFQARRRRSRVRSPATSRPARARVSTSRYSTNFW
jgi:hypothetical protein